MYYLVHNLVKRDREALVRLFCEERTAERGHRQCLVGEELFEQVNISKRAEPKAWFQEHLSNSGVSVTNAKRFLIIVCIGLTNCFEKFYIYVMYNCIKEQKSL